MLNTMSIGRRCARYLVPGAVLAGMLLALRPCAFGLDPALEVSQYAHTAWKVREGFSKSEIVAIAQAPDGYLLLGTEFGLFRFDGVRNVPWYPEADQHLPSNFIFSLLVGRDGTLWIGTEKGLASWKDGKLTQYSELAGNYIYTVVEDHEGTIWATGVAIPTGKLCAIHNGIVRCYGEDGTLGRGVFNLYTDVSGNLWAGVKDGLWRWRPDSPKFYPLYGEANGIQAIGEGIDGTLLVGWKGGLYQFDDGTTKPYSVRGKKRQFAAKRILRDRDGGVWIGTISQGLLHVHQGRIDAFTESDGLSGNSINNLFEDREGNVWVATFKGLDRFRDFPVVTFNVKQGLSNDLVGSVLADRDGSVWLGTYGGLNRWKSEQITIPPTGSPTLDGKLNGANPHSLFRGDRGRLWISTRAALGYLEHDAFIPVIPVSGGTILSMAQDRNGNLWAANEPNGLFRLSPQGNVRQFLWTELGHKDHASALVADSSDGGLWVGFHYGGIVYFKEGQERASYASGDGLGEGRVNDLRFDHEGTLWAATEGGLSRLKNGEVTTLTSKNGLPCDAVSWVIEDDARALWLYMACGLVRIDRPELDSWFIAGDKDRNPQHQVKTRVFDTFDGVRMLADSTHFSPQVAKTSDGRIWFLPWDGVSVIDPRHLPFNKLPPPVHIEQIIADHKTYAGASDANGSVRLPPLIRDLQIDYTALSLAAPEKVLFRYKLEGWDRDWQDVGTRRQAFYSNLPPRNYTFRVKACNNSGVWNEAGTSLEFFVAPAYYQTWWFRTACVGAFLVLAWTFYHMRLRQLERQFSIGLEARVSERTRIARDLHDTMLQSFQGVLLKFHALTFMLTDRPDAQELLENLVEEASQAITEGREAVQGVRGSTVVTNDLARSLTQVGQRLVAEQDGQSPVAFHVKVEGDTRDLHPIIRDEVYRIASESLRNSFHHSGAARIEVDIHYDERQFRVRSRDNGKGIDPKILEGGGRVGHYGLPGMHERAKLVGGKLAIWSQLNSGTEIELTIPASRAYAKSRAPRRLWFVRKGA